MSAGVCYLHYLTISLVGLDPPMNVSIKECVFKANFVAGKGLGLFSLSPYSQLTNSNLNTQISPFPFSSVHQANNYLLDSFPNRCNEQ